MRRGTTPTLTCQIYGANLSDSTIYATIQQGGAEINLKNPQVESTETGCTVIITLTQEQTLMLKPGTVDVQLRWVDANGTALATDVAQLNVYKVLKEGVIDYEQ